MVLTYEQIRQLATGVVDHAVTDLGLCLYRFTPDQRVLDQQAPYIQRLKEMYRGTGGVKLSFRTDSRTLYFCADVAEPCTSRSICAISVLVDGQWAGGWRNCPEATPEGHYSDLVCPMDQAEIRLELAEGWKDVCIYLPWSACTVIETLELDDGAQVEPVVPDKLLLCHGDSITMGCHALWPHSTYTARLARAMGAQEVNKGLAGGVSFPELTALPDGLEPDCITVAYGTNDWRKDCPERFLDCYDRMVKNLRQVYPKAPIFLITPLWRGDIDGNTKWSDFGLVEQYIRQIAQGMDKVHVICGMELVPHEEAWFADYRLHPNDAGYEHYFNNLWARMRPILEG